MLIPHIGKKLPGGGQPVRLDLSQTRERLPRLFHPSQLNSGADDGAQARRKVGQMDCCAAQSDQRFLRLAGNPQRDPQCATRFGGQNVSSAIAACKAVTASIASPQITNVDAATVRVLMAERVLNRIAARAFSTAASHCLEIASA
jgi:hypothetical protein